MTILVMAPHPDDEVIGCGGAILLAAGRGDRVVVVFLTSGELGLRHLPPAGAWSIRENEARDAAGVLGTAEPHFFRLPDWGCAARQAEGADRLRAVLGAERPALLYLPHPGEEHPDHAACLPIARLALGAAGLSTPELRGYEVWTPLAAHDHVEDISPVMARKLEALACYRSQLTEFRYDRAVTGLNQYRGALAGRCDYAEVACWLEPVAMP